MTRFGEMLSLSAKFGYNFTVFSIWKHFELTLGMFMIGIGQIFIVFKAKY